jgi:Spy/CpxP family protein refolding chaperone
MSDKTYRFSRFCPRRAAVAAATALTLACAGAALAQPTMGPGGPMGHAPRGPGAFGEHIGLMLEEAKSRLQLDTSQQLLWDNAVAQSRAARESGRALHQKARDAMRTELAKAEPDLAAIAAAADGVHAEADALRRQVRDQWLKLYATFNAQQKAIVREMMQQRMERAERFRERMRERWGARS